MKLSYRIVDSVGVALKRVMNENDDTIQLWSWYRPSPCINIDDVRQMLKVDQIERV